MSATSGGPAVFLSVSTFNETKTDFDTDVPAYNNLATADALIAAFQADTTNWIQLPEVDQELGMTMVEETEDIVPLINMHRTSDVVTLKGIDQISFGFPRRDNDSLHRFIQQLSTKSTVSAGASQVPQTILTLGSGFKGNTYNHLALVFREATNYYRLALLYKVRAVGAVEMTYGHSVTRIPAVFKVFAHTGTGFSGTNDQGVFIQQTGVQSA